MSGMIERSAQPSGAYRAPLVTLVSASGGVGKSTIALMIAHATARQVLKTALVEGDLQFGDMGFWLGLDVGASNLSLGLSCAPIPISNHLSLYKAPPLPEVAEQISEATAHLVTMIRRDYALVIADTGQFWSGLTGELLCSSDLVLLVMDHRKASVYGAIKALELCQRLGVPAARIACILNRASKRTKAECENIKSALKCSELFHLADGKSYVESLIGTGRVEELIEGESAPVPDIHRLLSTLLPRIGIDFEVETPRRTRRLFA